MGVFELPEGVLDVGLGPVGGDDLGGCPVGLVGDQDAFAENAFLQACPGRFLDLVCEPELFRALTGEVHGEDFGDPGVVGDSADACAELLAGAAGAAGEGLGQFLEPAGGLGLGLIETAGLGGVQGR